VPNGLKCAAAHVFESQNSAEKPRIQKPLSPPAFNLTASVWGLNEESMRLQVF
jgi:hypothetical protein